MKKLMTMIAAVATAFGLYAANPGTDFSGYTLDKLNVLADDTGATGTGDTRYWTYTSETVPDDALPINKGETTTNLAFKTGNETIYRNFTAQNSSGMSKLTFGNPMDIDDALYADMQITFGAPADEISIPTNTKFVAAIIDEFEAAGDAAALTSKGTNLWVIGGYYNGSTIDNRAFRMQVKGNSGSPITIDETWLAAAKRVAFKAYETVNAEELPGFILYVGNNFCTVQGSAPIVNGAVDYANYAAVTDDYLGAAAGITQTYRYGLKQLLLPVASGAALTAVGFKGTGSLGSIALGAEAPEGIDFTDAVQMTVTIAENFDADSAKYAIGGVTNQLVAGANAIEFAPGSDITVAVAYTGKIVKWLLDGIDVTDDAEEDNAYTIEGAQGGASLVITASEVGAYAKTASGDVIARASIADALGVEGVVEVVLAKGETLENPLYVEKSIVIDLAGCTIDGENAPAEYEGLIGVAEGAVLSITNSTGVGVISNSVANAAVTVFGGSITFENANYIVSGGLQDLSEGAASITVKGGLFSNKIEGENVTLPTDYDWIQSGDYWTVGNVTYVAQIGDKKYVSFEAAVAEAQDGDTIELIAETQLTTEKLLIAKNIAIDAGEFTLKGPEKPATGTAYGPVIDADVVIVGGTFEARSGQTLFNIGDSELGATGAGSLIISNGTFKGGGVVGAAGNLIATVNGTLTIEDGTFGYIGSRGIKAEGTGAVTINGGTFGDANTGDKLICFASGSTCSLIINGGDFTGKMDVEKGGDITIPGTSTATFDRDQTAFCAEGYGTKEKTAGVWSVEELYTITFKVGDVVTTNKIFKGDAVTHADPTAPTGYTFSGWQPAIVTPAVDDADYVAQFAAVEYTITYTTGNGAVVTNGVTKYTIETETFALPVAADIDMSKVEGVTFDGWTNATSEAVVTQVQKGTTGNLEFFANWEAVAPAEKDPTEDDPQQIPDTEKASDRYGDKVPTTLANVSAKSIATWAQNNGNLVKGAEILENAFLLNCENTEAAINAAKENFKATSITIDSDGKVTVGTPDGAQYNGTIKKLGKAELKDAEWSEDLEGKKFFELKLVPTNLN